MNKKEINEIKRLVSSLDTAIRFNVPLFGESLISIRDILSKIIEESEVDDGITK